MLIIYDDKIWGYIESIKCRKVIIDLNHIHVHLIEHICISNGENGNKDVKTGHWCLNAFENIKLFNFLITSNQIIFLQNYDNTRLPSSVTRLLEAVMD